MATPQIIAARTMDAVERLDKAQQELQELLNIEFTPEPVTNKDKDVARFQQLNNIAGFIETVSKAVKSKREADKGKPEKEPEPPTPTLTAPSTPPVVTQQPKPPTATLSPPEPKKPGRPPHKAK